LLMRARAARPERLQQLLAWLNPDS
jgi:hypothetical protein